jgi:hypothetical protein
LDLSRNSKFLYTLNCGARNLNGFHVQSDGGLVPLGAFGTLPVGAVGVAAS